MSHGKTYNKSPRRINHKATKSKTNTGTTALERSVEKTTGGFKALLQLANFTLGPDATLNTETHKNSVRIKAPNSVNASKRKHKNQINHYNKQRPECFDQFSKIVICCKQKGYNINVRKQSACLAVDPIMVDRFACLFNCTPLSRGSDSMMGLT